MESENSLNNETKATDISSTSNISSKFPEIEKFEFIKQSIFNFI
jgi:hypothetical protein